MIQPWPDRHYQFQCLHYKYRNAMLFHYHDKRQRYMFPIAGLCTSICQCYQPNLYVAQNGHHMFADNTSIQCSSSSVTDLETYDFIVSKARSKLFATRRIMSLPKNVTETLYKSLVQPLLDYCDGLGPQELENWLTNSREFKSLQQESY